MDRFSKFRLREKEEAGIELEIRDIKQCKEECEKSVVGKVWGVKAVNFSGLRNTFSRIWSQKGDLKVVELGFNFFQFIFSSIEERNRVLQKRPWFFDNQVLVIQPWRPHMRGEDPSFHQVHMWVQIHGLPTHWISKDVGWKLCDIS